MNREDIMRMAREAGWHDGLLGVSFTVPLLERFAALVAAAEREACAKVCEALGNDASIDEMEYRAFREADEAIRKRGEVKP